MLAPAPKDNPITAAAIERAVEHFGQEWLTERPERLDRHFAQLVSADSVPSEQWEIVGPWYVVICLPQQESVAAAGLIGRRFRAYLPTEMRSVRVNAIRRRAQMYPMFPCYLFASFDVCDERWKRVFNIAGIRKVIMIDERPVPIPDEAMARIRDKEAELAQGKSRAFPPLRVKVGDWVQLVDLGSFTGLFASVTETDLKAQSVQLELTLFGAARRVWAPVNAVKVV
jgi:transcription antitermination factor NusG